MEKQVSILLVGIGGYGEVYVRSLLNHAADGRFIIKGVVDPKPEACSRYAEIINGGVPVFASLDDFYRNAEAELTVISSPIQYHCPQTCTALRKYSNVLCEKPMCATIEDAMKMMKARDESGKFLAIGYQWSFSKAVQALKQDVIKGILGRPKRLKTIVLWPRDDIYYKRGWAGKKRDSNGNWILDSVANNATAHYLHNMFYILGEKMDASARPEYAEAELYRANNIENFDTSVVRTITGDNTEIMFYASHAVDSLYGPAFRYEFENAVATFESTGDNPQITVVFKDGKTKSYGNPSTEIEGAKLWTCIDAVLENTAIPCGPEAAFSHTLCINAMQESVPDIATFSDSIIRIKENPSSSSKVKYVDGLGDALLKCYDSWLLPGEAGYPWSRAGKKVYIDDLLSAAKRNI